MDFPPHISDVLAQWGIQPATREALYDLYSAMGNEVLELFADIAEKKSPVSSIEPEDLSQIREKVIDRYLTKNHPKWLEGQPTASFWFPRMAQGRASGILDPLGLIGTGHGTEITSRIESIARTAVGDSQPLPAGVAVRGLNAHFGGRAETVSFDVVALNPDDARAIAHAEGRQHTVPGSVGETSGTYDSRTATALIWEIQPNVLKPVGERNREIAAVYRKHRNWHVLTLVSALVWLSERVSSLYVLRGSALPVAHEVNPRQPVAPEIPQHHDRTVDSVCEVMGFVRRPTNADDATRLLNSSVLNTALQAAVEGGRVGELIDRLEKAS